MSRDDRTEDADGAIIYVLTEYLENLRILIDAEDADALEFIFQNDVLESFGSTDSFELLSANLPQPDQTAFPRADFFSLGGGDTLTITAETFLSNDVFFNDPSEYAIVSATAFDRFGNPAVTTFDIMTGVFTITPGAFDEGFSASNTP